MCHSRTWGAGCVALFAQLGIGDYLPAVTPHLEAGHGHLSLAIGGLGAKLGSAADGFVHPRDHADERDQGEQDQELRDVQEP